MSDQIQIIVQDTVNNISVAIAEPLESLQVQITEGGLPGLGFPAGGTAGQVMTKRSSANYDAEWVDPSGNALGLAVAMAVALG